MTTSRTQLGETQAAELRRSVRLVSILRSAEMSGFTPLPELALHTIAYLADALSPVWGFPILDAQILKQPTRPYFPALQRDLDRLIGRGVVRVDSLHIARRGTTAAPVTATYSLTELAEPALDAIQSSEHFGRQFEFVREVTFAAASLGPDGLNSVGAVDASYSDPLADFGSVIDLTDSTLQWPTSAQVAQRFRVLAPEAQLTDAQVVHLYLRHLYARLQVA